MYGLVTYLTLNEAAEKKSRAAKAAGTRKAMKAAQAFAKAAAKQVKRAFETGQP